ncbi:MAG: sigma-70 family RNA polymerase sigma factor [Deltaproteobacteria bacterium]|nr:sigma-70 family RNA polymerase sigma factor [Deltaproteobacteria bacterium]
MSNLTNISISKTAGEGSANDDNELINGFIRGDHSAFENIVLRYQDRVFNICFRLLGDRDEAEDSAQEVFIKVYRALKGFRFKSSFYTWLYRIVINTCKNRIKSVEYRSTKSRVSIDSDQENRGNTIADIVDQRPMPDKTLEQKQKMERIQEALNSLPPEQKTMIVLCDIEGLSYDEIAGITKTRLGTVKSKISRARLGLRNKLEGII